ncbi:MAG: DUF3419 family protein [Bacteroidetes bacterium]|nr:DUF3419 family protein [Bacteroidota bacterium]
MNRHLETVRHDYIRYANCWEDADVLLEALQLKPGNRVLSIASAGDNSLSMLVEDVELVVAADVNPVQLFLTEIKKAAIEHFDYSDCLGFLGFNTCDFRNELFQKIKNTLSPDCRLYWEIHTEWMNQGFIYIGKFEKYFLLFRQKILPWVHSQSDISELMKTKIADEQKIYFHNHWNSWRWRWLFRIFFSRYVMGRFGRDKAFMKEVEVSVSDFILKQAARHLSSVYCQTNGMLRMIMSGTFGDDLPHYVREENFDKIKSRIHRLELFEGYAQLSSHSKKGFDKFNLSNIFEYMSPEMFSETVRQFVAQSRPGSRFAYWNLMVPRIMSNVNSELNSDTELEEQLRNRDRGFFYSGIHSDFKL